MIVHVRLIASTQAAESLGQAARQKSLMGDIFGHVALTIGGFDAVPPSSVAHVACVDCWHVPRHG
jgi:hypothetical protein